MGYLRTALRVLSAVIAAALIALPALAAAEGGSPSWDLYRSGKPREAVAAARRDLARVMLDGTPTQHWSLLMEVAWLEESIGEHRQAMKTSARALEVATKLDDPFKAGRSLSWLGWSASSLGLYPLALEFYDDAIATATRGEKIQHPMVWGIATQEKGAVLAKMGDLVSGTALIKQTTDFARRHDILVGVSEGAAHLSGIALQQGDLTMALDLAEEAVIASEGCDCSAYNTNRARLTLARVLLEKSRTNPKFASDAEDMIRRALEAAEAVADRRHIAEAKLLLSYVIDPEDLPRRQALVTSAASILHATESELRGKADGELGALFLESDAQELAAAYLRSGFKINVELMRKVDSAYILGDLAQADEIDGDTQASLEKWMVAAEEAEASGAWVIAAESQERLSEDLHRLGLASLALEWTNKALASHDYLIANASEPERHNHLKQRALLLSERRLELVLALEHTAGTPPPLVTGME